MGYDERKQEGRGEMKKVPGKVPDKCEVMVHDDISMGVLQQGGEALTPPTMPRLKVMALKQAQVGERHVLEHLDVAWGNGVGGGRVRRNEEGSRKGSQQG